MIKVENNICTISGDIAELLTEFSILLEAIRKSDCPELLIGLTTVVRNEIKEMNKRLDNAKNNSDN